jgi:hypothetical protein
VGDDSHLLFRQKLLREDGSVRRGDVFARFHAVTEKRGSRTRNSVWPVMTGSSRYHNCCKEGGTSPEYFEYRLVAVQMRATDYFHHTAHPAVTGYEP